MYLTPGQSLEVKLAGAIATTELPVTAAFFEGATASMDAAAWGAPTTVTAGAAAVTAVADPGAGKMRQVKHLTIANVDTAPAIVTVQVNDGGTPRVLKTITLAVGYSLEFTDTDGFRVLDGNGAVMGVGAAGPPGPPGPVAVAQTDVFAPAAGQTVFALAFAPAALGLFQLSCNGLVCTRGTHYTQVGLVLTWLNVNYTLATTDELVATYQI